ncbi:MAG: hypothetical protein K6357_00935 [Elusimicrobiota bacterium]
MIKNINIESNGFEVEAEISLKLAYKKYSVMEIPITYKPRTHKEGKKISLKDGFKGLWIIVKFKIISLFKEI